MNTIQSHYPSMYQTDEQRKALYDRMYDENGNMRLTSGDFKQNIQVVSSQGGECKASEMSTKMGTGYAVEKVGDDYVMFAMTPSVYFGGDKELSAEQLEYLRGKYDMDNLSNEDRIKLLAELSCMGIISGSDAYAEAFPEKCSWMKDHQQLGIDNNTTDLETWVQYYLQRAMQAKDDMNKLIANSRTEIAYVEAERRTNIFYSKLAKVMNEIGNNNLT